MCRFKVLVYAACTRRAAMPVMVLVIVRTLERRLWSEDWSYFGWPCGSTLGSAAFKRVQVPAMGSIGDICLLELADEENEVHCMLRKMYRSGTSIPGPMVKISTLLRLQKVYKRCFILKRWRRWRRPTSRRKSW
jgi:hypothetical protein